MSLCALHDAGISVCWDSVLNDKTKLGYKKPSLLRGLPTFPWQHKSYWHESEVEYMAIVMSSHWSSTLTTFYFQVTRQSRFREVAHELLGHRLHHAQGAWENELSLQHVPYLIGLGRYYCLCIAKLSF